MVVIGTGIGLFMQVVILVAQNDAPPSQIGTATSSATFFRSIGGSVGVAIFGAIFSARLTSGLERLPAAAVAQLHLTAGSVQVAPNAVQALPEGPRSAFLAIFVHALHGAFAWGAIFSALAFALTWALPQIELRSSSAAQLREQVPVAPQTPETIAR
jgi:hypothetical protein